MASPKPWPAESAGTVGASLKLTRGSHGGGKRRVQVHEEERLAGRLAGPHPTGEPERRAEDADRSARPGRFAYHSNLPFGLLRCAKNLFLGPPFVRADPDGRSLRELKTRAEGEEEQGQAG